MTKIRSGRSTPPDDDDWQHIWPALDRADKSWVIIGPIWAVVSNWKALCVVFSIVAWINVGEIKGIILAILEASK